jgi:hypothetical protein
MGRGLLFLLGCVAVQAADFAANVFPVLDQAGCAACHNHDGVASATRLQFPERGADAVAIQRFGLSLRRLVDTSSPEKSLLLLKPTARMPHAGGKRIAPDSAAERTLRAWVDYLATTNTVDVEPVSAEKPSHEPVLRRLTNAQYNNTVRDLLGDDSNIAAQFPPEDFVNGFKTQGSGQAVSPLLAEAYCKAAERLAANAFRGGDTRGLIPCKPASFTDAVCRSKFTRTFGRKAFRRPLTNAEVTRYEKLFAAGAAERKDFLDGARLVIEAMLQSPAFLLRLENSPDPYDAASRLSYALWNSMPDEELVAAAASGELTQPGAMEKQARRMLADSRARGMLDDYLEQWLRFDRLLTSVKDRRTYPQYTPELALAMTEETRRLTAELVWNNGNFMHFYSADYAFISSSLATLYGLTPPAREFDRVALPAASERAGFLGQALFLALTSKPAETSPTARGLFVREQLLCQEVPQPPPGVAANLPLLAKEKPQTNRERLAIHLNSESCSSCHNLIDPIGFGFEKFDALGQRREKLKLTFTAGRREKPVPPVAVELELDTTGDVAGIPESAFSSPRELGNILANSAQCQECVVKQFFRYAMGRKETPADRQAIRRIYEDFRESGFRFQELMVSLVKRTGLPPGGDASGSGSH